MGKRTMLHYDNGATVLLVEGLGFGIVEGDFYTRRFRCGNSYVSRQELEGFPYPFCTAETTDSQMQRIVEEADAATRAGRMILLFTDKNNRHDAQNDRTYPYVEPMLPHVR